MATLFWAQHARQSFRTVKKSLDFLEVKSSHFTYVRRFGKNIGNGERSGLRTEEFLLFQVQELNLGSSVHQLHVPTCTTFLTLIE